MPTKMIGFLLSAFCMCLCSLIGASDLRAEEKFEVVGVCDILKDPPRWKGRLVAVRGYYDFGLRDVNPCARTFITEGYQWPEAIDLTSASETVRPSEIGTKEKAFSLGEFYDRLRSERKNDGPGGLLVATFYGRLNAREKYVRVKTNYGLLANGFGHLGAFPVQLSVYIVQDIARREPRESK
jgi:hypothetical protein